MERRIFPRVELILPVSLTYKNTEITGEIHNVSINGMFVKTSEDLEIDAAVVLSLQPDKDKPEIIECCGKIVRKTDSGVGIQIESMGLQSYIKWRYVVTKAINSMDELLQETPTFVVQ